MAVTQNPIIGRSRNKVAGVIFQTWKGLNVVRSKPLTVANPRTDGQLQQRSKLGLAVSIYRQIAGAITVGFKEQAVQKSEYNAFVSDIIKNAMTLSGNDAVLVEASMKVSKGTISPQTVNITSPTVGNSEATANFSPAVSAPGQSVTDLFGCVLYNETQDLWVVYLPNILRSAGSAFPDFNNAVATSDVLHYWPFFYNNSTRKSSDNTYVTDTV